MRTWWLYVLIVAFPFTAAAQTTDGTWFFGSGGSIVFENGTISTPSGALFTEEGCASQCDANGDPLFFTNGEVVMDRNGNQMPNGFGLAGSFSSTQSAVIVPMLDGTDRYYIFTTPAMMGNFSILGITGLAFSIVDMGLNGGLGDVTEKNTVLFDNVTEKLTATRHANGQDVWVVAHEWDSDRYVAFLVTCNGIEGPVISSAGRVMEFIPGADIVIPLYASVGAMDISPDGSTLASTWATVQDGNIDGISFLDLLHFNDTTGVASDWLQITHGGPGLDIRGYGLAFSPSGSKLYQTEFARMGFNNQGVIRQYDLSAADVPATEYIVTQDMPELGLVQAAPNGDMLVAILFGDGIAGITGPESAGAACGFVPDLVQLSVGSSMWGLPNDWDTGLRALDPLDPLGLPDTAITCSDTLWVRVDIVPHPFQQLQILWSTGATVDSIAITVPGAYSVSVIGPCDTITDAFTVTGSLNADLLGEPLRACSDPGVELRIPDRYRDPVWSTSDTGSTFRPLETGWYTVSASDSAGCIITDSVHVDLENCACTVYLPNAFTPNGDGVNDSWTVVHDCTLSEFDLTVFDRWGRAVFTSTDPAVAWSGAGGVESPIEVYAYRLSYAFWDGLGTTQRNGIGSVTLVR